LLQEISISFEHKNLVSDDQNSNKTALRRGLFPPSVGIVSIHIRDSRDPILDNAWSDALDRADRQINGWLNICFFFEADVVMATIWSARQRCNSSNMRSGG
jgi:hypothetical protein